MKIYIKKIKIENFDSIFHKINNNKNKNVQKTLNLIKKIKICFVNFCNLLQKNEKKRKNC